MFEYSPSKPMTLCTSGDRGVTRGDLGEGSALTSGAMLVSTEEERRRGTVNSSDTRVVGPGERFANGSSSRRSDGGEYLGVSPLLDGKPVEAAMGIAGGNTNSVVVAAAD